MGLHEGSMPVMPTAMGGVMGLAMGWMAGQGALTEVGNGFVLAHVIIGALLLAVAGLLPRVRAGLRSHFGNWRMIRSMLVGMACGLGAGLILARVMARIMGS